MKYPHRFNRDGTYDSICPICYLTIATRQQEVDLDVCEHEHVCRYDPSWDQLRTTFTVTPSA